MENETADGYSVFILIIKISVSHRIYVKNVAHFGFKKNMVFKWIGPHQRSYAHMMKWKKWLNLPVCNAPFSWADFIDKILKIEDFQWFDIKFDILIKFVCFR